MNSEKILTGVIIEETTVFTLTELSRACGKPEEWITALVKEGILEPENREMSKWTFRGACLRRVRIVQNLERDLGINLAGAALALELLEEIEELRKRLAALET